MINFTVITDTPQRLASFLESRGIIKQVDDGQGGTHYVGVKPGMEWVRVPNPIVTTPAVGEPRLPDGSPNPAYVPAVYDDRAVFMVKFAHDSEAADDDGPKTVIDPETGKPVPVNQYERTKFGKWVKNNSTVVTAPANYTIHGQPVGDAYKINGENVWLVRNSPERFGVWQ